MKTEISRDSLQLEKRYSGVYQQQGRMLTDSDWNELVEILKGRVNDALRDVVGVKQGSIGGTPRHRALRIVEDTTDTFKIEPGHVYVDGIAARVPDGNTDYGAQDDFPLPPGLPASGNYILYADVWERTVTQLMDERLRDAGLHGADTCTRKQTMVQIKWSPDTIDPEQSASNPSKGDAELSLTLSDRTTLADDCDPCAAELKVDSNVGNYLFRVEVHDVKRNLAGQPIEVTLKWSSENGAEQFVALADKADMPAGFITDKWTYEFFDEVSEKHLGVHLENNSWEPVRGELKEINESTSLYSVPTTISGGTAPPPVLIRRWDGYCKIDLDTPDLSEGMDRGVPLHTNTGLGGLGYVDLTSLSAVKITLDSIDLEIDLNGKALVAGDFWLAEVREAVNDPLDPDGKKLIESKIPQGIEHRYLTLGQVDASGLIDNAEAERKYAFPALTEMTRMFKAGGEGQEAMPERLLPEPVQVNVANGEWPVTGARLRFKIESGTGTLLKPTSVPPDNFEEITPGLDVIITTLDGVADCDWTLGTTGSQRVKVSLLDPDDPTNATDLPHPPLYFNANLSTAEQVAYTSECPANGENTVHSHLVTDAGAPLPEAEGYYTVKTALDALLCHLQAAHIPYDDPNCPAPSVYSLLAGLESTGDDHLTVKDVLDTLLCRLAAEHVPYDPDPQGGRWDDINEGTSRPGTVQQALDDLAENLESTDIRYEAHTCALEPSVRSGLGIDLRTYRLDEILDKLLCEFKATHLPLDKSGTLCDKLKNNANVKSVQDAIHELCITESGGGCAITIGDGGRYLTFKELQDAIDNGDLKEQPRIILCLLPGIDKGAHNVEQLSITGRQTIHITGGCADIYLQGKFVLEAENITLDGIRFFHHKMEATDERGIGSILLLSNSGKVTVENCYFYRDFNGEDSDWQPLVSVGEKTSLKWEGNIMVAVRQFKEIISATIPRTDSISAEAVDVVDGLKTLFAMNPYEDPDVYESRIKETAQKIASLDFNARGEWFNARFKTRIDKLPNNTVNIPETGREVVINPPIPGRPIPVTPPIGIERTTRLVARSNLAPRDEVRNFYNILNIDGPLEADAITDVLRNVLALVGRPDYALALFSNGVGGWVIDNEIDGYVALHQAQDKPVPLIWGLTDDPKRQKRKQDWALNQLTADWKTSQQIFIEGNKIIAVHSKVAAGDLKALENMLQTGGT
jgi:hypothetical protein